MKVIKGSREFRARELYSLTEANDILSVNKVETNADLTILHWLLFEKEDKDGNPVELLTILGTNSSGEQEKWCTQSETFKRSFATIVDLMEKAKEEGDEEPFTIRKIDGTAKSGRPYVDCTL